MKKLDEYFTDEKIILILCRIRAKLAKQRGQKHLIHLLSADEHFNYHLNAERNNNLVNDEILLLNSLLPSRKKWKKLNKKSRYSSNGQRINSIDNVVNSLLVTIKFYKINFPNEPFLNSLNSFINNLRMAINSSDYTIKSPVVLPRLKSKINNFKNICRPISLFNLKDRIIISLTNQYLTDLFDDFFHSSSFAFRSVRREEAKKKIVNHHSAIEAITNYKKRYRGKRLWVAECDISKFFDSVHQKIVKTQFKRMIKLVKKNKPNDYDSRAEAVFYKYLDSYSFVKNVLPLNGANHTGYWERHKIPLGEFGWVKSGLIKKKYFKNFNVAKIGIPQGGALSGLIANLVLDFADRKMQSLNDSKLLYVRFCDDMIIIHPSKKKAIEASKTYYKALEELHLIPHEFVKNLVNDSRNALKQFWNSELKSKSPYMWSSNYSNSFQWFGFVGYEIHYTGQIRVRKSSILKEKTKQKEVVNNILKAIKFGKRKSDQTVQESAINRLIGMSVGRINMNDFDKVENDMCWVNGFLKLNDNPHVRAQLKDLDKCRAKQFSKLIRETKKISNGMPIKVRNRISKVAFCPINGISEKQSLQIRNLLQKSEILDMNFYVNSKVDFEELNWDLILGIEFIEIKEEILYLLLNAKQIKGPLFYGKPYSYFYHVIEKKV